MLAELRFYSRLAAGMSDFLRTKPVSDPRGLLLEQRQRRPAAFLDLAKRAIFDRPEQPYNALFREAGCTYGDLAASVERDGLEGALEGLYRSGVYLTHDEYKGKTPVVRGATTLQLEPGLFSSPFAGGKITSGSSGSRGVRSMRTLSMGWQLYREAMDHVLHPALGLNDAVRVSLMPMLPAIMGLRRAMVASRQGCPVARWFAAGGAAADSGHYRLLTRLFALWSRLHGARVPAPRWLDRNDYRAAAKYVAEVRAAGRGCVVDSVVTPAVRLAAAAREHGLDIAGTVFLVAGEALTGAKRAVIESAGGAVLPTYVVSEVGMIGIACGEMRSDNCVHLLDDAFAVISRRRRAPMSEVELDSLLFTTAAPWSPNVLINVEMDDSGIVGEAPCECGLARLGYGRQVRNIFSYGKLTGQGTTLIGGDVVRILEESLPGRFGGNPGDYQLVEREDGTQTSIELRVRPAVAAGTPDEISRFFLSEIARLFGGAVTRREWVQTDAVKVTIAEPYTTRTGKVLSLHLLGVGGKP